MSFNPIDKHYDRLKPEERVTLVVEAMARDDSPETDRLHASCPRGSYSGPDVRFYERLTMAFETVAVVTVDLRCMWAKLHMLDWVMGDVVPSLATAQQVTAAMAFVDGECCGQGIRQIHFFARPLEDKEEPDGDGGAEEEDIDDLGEEGEEEDERPQSKWHEDRGRRLDAVQKRAEHFTACSLLARSLTAQEIAQDLVNTWAAFGTFCRTRIGVTPETMLRAWQFPVEGDFRETLQRYAPLKPDSEKVKEYTRYICIHWDRQFGRPRDDRHGDGDGDDDGGDDDVG